MAVVAMLWAAGEHQQAQAWRAAFEAERAEVVWATSQAREASDELRVVVDELERADQRVADLAAGRALAWDRRDGGGSQPGDVRAAALADELVDRVGWCAAEAVGAAAEQGASGPGAGGSEEEQRATREQRVQHHCDAARARASALRGVLDAQGR